MITKINRKHLISFSFIICYLSFSVALSSCSDLMDTESEFVEFEENNKLQQATDSVYSVMGIIYKMQAIADRTVLLGELRGDLTTTTDAASLDLKAISSFEVDTKNAYNRISDYYAIINNCNYFLTHVNKDLAKGGQKVFEDEYAAVKAFRAWTYLQLALIYGQVPLITEPLLTEEAAQKAMTTNISGIEAICDYFIKDLTLNDLEKPYVDMELPNYGKPNWNKFFIPVRALLGDLCLWAGRYQEAAQYYHDYLALRTNPITTGTSRASWYDTRTKEFRLAGNSFRFGNNDSECLSYIPMESSEFYGIKSDLLNIFNSNDLNRQYAQVMPTAHLRELSAASNYCYTFTKVDNSIDTLYAPKENLTKSDYIGDLRLGTIYTYSANSEGRFPRVSEERQSFDKYPSNADGVTIYRTNMVYLRYAEALNRAGYPQSAFAVLKYGLYDDILNKWIDETEREAAGNLIDFDIDLFTKDNTQGIHARGSGNSECDTLYVLPQPAMELNSRQDTVNYQMPLVEDMIIYEMALEGAFEGYRFYDLMRVALRRGDNAYLADPISLRNGTVDAGLREKLMNKENWYLPLR